MITDNLWNVIVNFYKVVSNENVHMHSGRHCSKVTVAKTSQDVKRRGSKLSRTARTKSQKQWWMVDLMEELPVSFINISFALDEPVVKR